MALAEAEYSMTDGAMRAPNSRFFADETLLVKFYMKPTHNKNKSKEEGRPIFEDIVWVSIIVPGNKNTTVERVARDTDKQRFSKHFEAFESHGTEEFVSGTPLDSWPVLSSSQVKEMAFFNVRTIEQLANMPDSEAQKFMGIAILRTKAKMFLEAAAGGAPMEALQDAMEEKDNQLAAMKESLDSQAQMIADLQAKID